MSGLWLSDGWFRPKSWQFPEGSILDPHTYAIVWLDDDGAKCPSGGLDPPDIPWCLWECPDPTDPAISVYHASFELRAANDQAFLWDTEKNNHDLIGEGSGG